MKASIAATQVGRLLFISLPKKCTAKCSIGLSVFHSNCHYAASGSFRPIADISVSLHKLGMTNVTSPSQWHATRARRLYDEHERLEAMGNHGGSLQKLEEAAALGAVYALHDLGYTYYNAEPPKVREALIAYGKAARMGEGASAWNLARHFELQPNPARYFFWLRVAHRLNIEEAEEELASPFPYLLQKCLDGLQSGRTDEAAATLRLICSHGIEEACAAMKRLGM